MYVPKGKSPIRLRERERKSTLSQSCTLFSPFIRTIAWYAYLIVRWYTSSIYDCEINNFSYCKVKECLVRTLYSFLILLSFHVNMEFFEWFHSILHEALNLNFYVCALHFELCSPLFGFVLKTFFLQKRTFESSIPLNSYGIRYFFSARESIPCDLFEITQTSFSMYNFT